MDPLRIARAENDLLFDEAGRAYIDLFTAHGTTFLGHGNRAVTAAVGEQLGKVWVTGALATAAGEAARAAVEGCCPASHRLAALYSTGMEAAEFALRVARVATGRLDVIGFAGGMHGKSLATSALGWDNGDGVRLPFVHRLPFPPTLPEEQVLDRVADTLAGRPVSAVFVEPIQGAGGGHTASAGFFRELAARCADHGALLVFDEILTGFYRTGPLFVFSDLGLVPDVVLVGKAMGNGFPVSGVVLNRWHPVRPEMLPGSTFAGNPLAAAAVAATLGEMRSLDLPGLVARIAAAAEELLGPLRDRGIPVRGRGAFWVIELPPGPDAQAVVVSIYRSGVAVGAAGRYIRVLPPATIDPANLRRALSVVRDRVREAYP